MFDEVKDYYGKVLQSSGDLKTDACCTDTAMPDHLKQAMSKIHAELASRYYGCGLVRPQQLEGMRILDLGSGSGRDCYIVSNCVINLSPDKESVLREALSGNAPPLTLLDSLSGNNIISERSLDDFLFYWLLLKSVKRDWSVPN